MSDDELELPRGVISKRGRWAGEQLEIEHQHDSTQNEKSKTVAAVDIRQFQNHVVGEGYQAKHVVRQASAPTTAAIKDMTGGVSHKIAKSKTADESPITAEMLLQNDGIRAFRRELETLLK
mmetsp:Transcript_135370/g.201326  ORF Transcript_135370/g.201326 Transcript_135370/m.201326 type:complete len:121 (+) Transcript_135370:102-464(+)|eukprot:CAMPEP_0117010928 /NCGR_PEP_ID=MMETSP0472-20121206/9509_1 /TAXON_ID=693140 ORGANISM="Tiarina fusus, Strain LIS" /NCGR_SAMPLE_ID=MMETSP0472 /ASSEMBLY_ACC=CAM_ASM_000603 /LENGTH=120 /DNA_ID=CAMNT_0004713589 /DNA_START=133 /DNA_END=495 /DNA_ORIENTATION=+